MIVLMLIQLGNIKYINVLLIQKLMLLLELLYLKLYGTCVLTHRGCQTNVYIENMEENKRHVYVCSEENNVESYKNYIK